MDRHIARSQTRFGMSPARLGGLTGVLLACGLAGCASEPDHSRVAYHHVRPAPALRHYTAPGPFNDPWGPYISAASARFGVSEKWIRAVMTQESSGDLYQDGGLTTSSVGAMGLMQVMPDTYDMLRERYGLGSDPYEPHDNIFAGTAYIREMYNIYGFPGFLAAYNAGPHQLEACLSTGASLPMETVNYLTSVAPKLRPYAVASGPLAAYANAPGEMPADDLNRRSLTGQAMPAVQILSAPTLACMPTAADRSADALNRDALAAAEGVAPPPPNPLRNPAPSYRSASTAPSSIADLLPPSNPPSSITDLLKR